MFCAVALRPIPRLRFGLGSGWLSTHEIDLESVSIAACERNRKADGFASSAFLLSGEGAVESYGAGGFEGPSDTRLVKLPLAVSVRIASSIATWSAAVMIWPVLWSRVIV